jgi:hypothetical protein
MSPDFTESYQCMWLFGDTLNSYNQTHYLNQPGNTVKPAESSTYPAINTATYVFDFSLLFQAMHKPVETALGTTGSYNQLRQAATSISCGSNRFKESCQNHFR